MTSPNDHLISEHGLPPAPNLGAYLDTRVAKYPEHTFWCSTETPSDRLTYRQFQDLTLKCSAGLQATGITRGSHVGVMLPNTPEGPIAWFSLARLGAVAVMIDAGSTRYELTRAIVDANVSTLICHVDQLDVADEALFDVPNGTNREVEVIVCGDGGRSHGHVCWSDLLETSDGKSPDVGAIGTDDVASIQFTSGSTGSPKPCMLTHRYWMTLGEARAVMGPRPSRILIDTPFHYMGPYWKLLMALTTGATAYVAPRYSLRQWLRRVQTHKIDFCTVANAVAGLPDHDDFRHTNLKWLASTGLSRNLHEKMEQRFGVPVRELYGMTEIGAALFMPIHDQQMAASGSCGQPVSFRKFRIVHNGRDVDDGESGELWAAGPGMFAGYYKRTQATNEAFDGEWFRTGDLFRRDAEGYYYMIGRIKDVIRRSSENISPFELETVINAVPGVLESAIVPVPSDFRGEEVMAYVALAPKIEDPKAIPKAVLNHCMKHLSAFKVPRYIVWSHDLPRTHTGKIDKNILKSRAESNLASCFDSSQST